MLRVGIFRPVGVPRANYALTHAFRGVNYIPTAWVSLCSVHYHRLWKASNRERAEARYPAFSFVVL